MCVNRGRLAAWLEVGWANPIVSLGSLAVALTVSVGVLIRLLPQVRQEGWTALPHGAFFWGALCLLLVSAGFVCSWVGRIVSRAATGKTPDLALELKLENALICLASWFACFVIGPIIPAAAGIIYWTQCGTIAAIDWLILADFAFIAAAYWLTLLTAMNAGRGIRGMLPTQVGAVYRQLGFTGFAITLLAVALLLALGLTTSLAASKIHAAEATGYLLLAVCCVSGPLALTLILYRLGAEYHRTEVLKDESPSGLASKRVVPVRS